MTHVEEETCFTLHVVSSPLADPSIKPQPKPEPDPTVFEKRFLRFIRDLGEVGPPVISWSTLFLGNILENSSHNLSYILM